MYNEATCCKPIQMSHNLPHHITSTPSYVTGPTPTSKTSYPKYRVTSPLYYWAMVAIPSAKTIDNALRLRRYTSSSHLYDIS